MVLNEALKPFVPQTQPMNITSFPASGDRLQDPLAYSEHTYWMGLDIMQDLWQDPIDLNGMRSDPQWEVLFRDLESEPGIFR